MAKITFLNQYRDRRVGCSLGADVIRVSREVETMDLQELHLVLEH